MNMETGDVIDLPPAGCPDETENDDLRSSRCEPIEADSQPCSSKLKEDKLTGNGCLTVQNGSPAINHKQGISLSGAKRPRMTIDEHQPSVHVKYDFLTRDSKQKLEELLQQWSEWHAKHCSSLHDSNEVLESGEEIYFPALHVGLEKPSAVSFWMDNKMRDQRSKDTPLDSNSVPLYDRGYSFGLTLAEGSSNLDGGLELGDASRCFNCGSYSHSLKECPKPHDKVAVNKARNQHKSKRNQSAGFHNRTRYYQDSPQGKYDGLRPGVLDAETRKLLGLEELDPPPWLNRMREIGYPPGYLDPEDEDRPSGITIFADEEMKEEEDVGPHKIKLLELRRKMSVEFPGINALIPKNADERRWASGSSSFNQSTNPPNQRSNIYSTETSEGQFREPRWSGSYREGPPGCDPGFNPGPSSFSQRYGGYESSYLSHTMSPSFGRSLSDRVRTSPFIHEGPSSHGLCSSLTFTSPIIMGSPRIYDSRSFEYWDYYSQGYLTPDSSSLHHSRW